MQTWCATIVRRYPVHRKLISLNKRFTGRGDPEFNLRHDWNSLLEAADDVPPVTQRSKERFPDADVLVDYLRDYARRQEGAGKIRYNTTVTRIDRDPGDAAAFVVAIEARAAASSADCSAGDSGSGGGDGQGACGGAGGAGRYTGRAGAIRCAHVINAMGVWKPNRPAKLVVSKKKPAMFSGWHFLDFVWLSTRARAPHRAHAWRAKHNRIDHRA